MRRGWLVIVAAAVVATVTYGPATIGAQMPGAAGAASGGMGMERMMPTDGATPPMHGMMRDMTCQMGDMEKHRAEMQKPMTGMQKPMTGPGQAPATGGLGDKH
jgi:hypothetical protein